MSTITHDDFINSGFAFDKEDIFYPYQYSLMDDDDTDDNDEYSLSLVAGNSPIFGNSFAISFGDGSFLTFNAQSPREAIEWAEKIFGFEPPY